MLSSTNIFCNNQGKIRSTIISRVEMTDERCSITRLSIENEASEEAAAAAAFSIAQGRGSRVGTGLFLGRFALGSMKTCYGRAARSESDMALAVANHSPQSLVQNPNAVGCCTCNCKHPLRKTKRAWHPMFSFRRLRFIQG